MGMSTTTADNPMSGSFILNKSALDYNLTQVSTNNLESSILLAHNASAMTGAPKTDRQRHGVEQALPSDKSPQKVDLTVSYTLNRSQHRAKSRQGSRHLGRTSKAKGKAEKGHVSGVAIGVSYTRTPNRTVSKRSVSRVSGITPDLKFGQRRRPKERRKIKNSNPTASTVDPEEPLTGQAIDPRKAYSSQKSFVAKSTKAVRKGLTKKISSKRKQKSSQRIETEFNQRLGARIEEMKQRSRSRIIKKLKRSNANQEKEDGKRRAEEERRKALEHLEEQKRQRKLKAGLERRRKQIMASMEPFCESMELLVNRKRQGFYCTGLQKIVGMAALREQHIIESIEFRDMSLKRNLFRNLVKSAKISRRR